MKDDASVAVSDTVRAVVGGLVEAGDRLAPFLQHDGGCAWRMKQHGRPCDCGLAEKWAAWEAAQDVANVKDEARL